MGISQLILEACDLKSKLAPILFKAHELIIISIHAEANTSYSLL